MLALWYVNSNLFKVYPVYPASIIYNSQIKYTQKKKTMFKNLQLELVHEEAITKGNEIKKITCRRWEQPVMAVTFCLRILSASFSSFSLSLDLWFLVLTVESWMWGTKVADRAFSPFCTVLSQALKPYHTYIYCKS
jgi:hypothetical protein